MFVDMMLRASRSTPMLGHMFGNPAQAPRLRAALGAAGSRVRCHGESSTTWALDRASVLVVTSTVHTQPYAVLEAMARGVPVVATDVGDVHRMVSAPEFGPPAGIVSSSFDELTAALVELANDSDRLRTLGRAGRERAARHFDAEHMRIEYDILYSFPHAESRHAA